MSDESIQLIRKPTTDERRLIAALVAKACAMTLPPEWLESLRVQPMADGRMGSLRLLFPQTAASPRFQKQTSEVVFDDADGVKVVASLNIDSTGLPTELDVWKTDFSPLVAIPLDLTGKS